MQTMTCKWLEEETQEYVLLGGGRLLSVEIHDIAGDFLDVRNAIKTNVEAQCDLRAGIVGTHLGGSSNEHVARAVRTLAMFDGDDVGGSVGLDRAAAGAGDNQDTLVGDGVSGVESLQVGPERSENNPKADQQKGHAENREDTEGLGKGIRGPGYPLGGVKRCADPEKREASERNTYQDRGQCGDGGAARVGDAGPIETFAGLQFRLRAELSIPRIHAGSPDWEALTFDQF